MELSEKILRLRKARGWSQDELADQLEVARQSVSKWESGQSTPEPDKIVRLADLFEVTTDYLLRPSENDDLRLKATLLEQQQQTILREQKKATNRQFAWISAFLALLACFVLYVVGKYIMFPDVGEGHGMLGKTVVMYGGWAVVAGLAVFANWQRRVGGRN